MELLYAIGMQKIFLLRWKTYSFARLSFGTYKRNILLKKSVLFHGSVREQWETVESNQIFVFLCADLLSYQT